MTMSNGIEIFDSKGRLQPLDVIEPQLTDATMTELFGAVRSAYEASAQVDADITATTDAIKETVAEVADAENYLKQHYPPRTFRDEWLAMKATRAAE